MTRTNEPPGAAAARCVQSLTEVLPDVEGEHGPEVAVVHVLIYALARVRRGESLRSACVHILANEEAFDPRCPGHPRRRSSRTGQRHRAGGA
jgi:hypothetical protein